MSDITRPHRDDPEPIAYHFGAGETLLAYWITDGHGLLKMQRARDPRPPGTVCTGHDVEIDHDIPAVWLMFEDAPAVRRMRDFLDTIARQLDHEMEAADEPS